MRLSPLDIRKQEFTRRLRGYDPEEVQAFLHALSAQWDSVLEEMRRHEERHREMESKLKHYERVEEALQEALQTARESSRQALQAAEQKARQIRSEAEMDAEKIKRDAEHDRMRLRQETQTLLSRRKEIASRLRGFLITEMEMLAHFEGEDARGYIKLMPSEQHRRLAATEELEDIQDIQDVERDVDIPADAAAPHHAVESREPETPRAPAEAHEPEAEPVQPTYASAAAAPPPLEVPVEMPAAPHAEQEQESMVERLLRLDEEAALDIPPPPLPEPQSQPVSAAREEERRDEEEEPAAPFWKPSAVQNTPAPEPATEADADDEPRTPWRQKSFIGGSSGSQPSRTVAEEEPAAPQEEPGRTAEDEIARIRRILRDLE